VVSEELMRFHRKEQMLKLRTILMSLMRLKREPMFSCDAELNGEGVRSHRNDYGDRDVG